MSQRKGSTKAQPKAASNAPAVAASSTDDEKARFQKLIEAASEKAPEKVRPYIVKAAPFLAIAIVYIKIAMPYIIKAIQTAEAFLEKVPEKILWATLGFLMCFFGGVFPATIAAGEAWSVCGGADAIANLRVLYKEFLKIADANKEDDEKDEDGDGVADVNQQDAKHLLERKVGVVLKTVNPETAGAAVSGLYTGWIGVLAILKIQFAKTVTLGNAIGEKFLSLAEKFAKDPLMKVVPEDYQKWVPMCMAWTCKAVAIWIAWWVQRVISAFHSAIRGGLMCSRGVVDFLFERNLIQFSSDDSEIDEYAGWAIAGVGFLFQLYMGFGTFFPFNLLLMPVTILENFIIYSVST